MGPESASINEEAPLVFVFGVFVDAQDVFDRHCLPGIAAHGGADATLITSGDRPVAATYNQMLEAAGDMDDVEAVVLLRQDVTVTDARFRDKVRQAFATDDDLVALLPTATTPTGPDGPADPAGAARALTSADGACLVLHPRMLAGARFDEEITGSHGHVLDLCRRLREQGRRVAMASLELEPHVEAVAASTRGAAAAWQGQHARRLGQEALARLQARQGELTGPGAPALEPAPGAGRRAGEEFLALDHSELVTHLPDGARRVLDLGCAAGTLGAAITAATGAHVVGVTDNEAHARLARTRLADVWPLQLDDTTSLPTEPASFDAVVAAGLLERLTDPAHALALAASALRPGGRIVATVPNVKHWSVLLPLLVQDRWEYGDAGLLARSSLRFFTLVEAAALFRDAGFVDFEVAVANEIPLADRTQLEGLLTCLSGYSVERGEAETLLDAYEYLVVATRP